jgi:uncharacterized protein involved in exopolysaccharide biosynthesis
LPFLVCWVGLFVAGGAIYSRLLRPDYIATAQVLLQPRTIVNDGPEKLRRYQQLMIDSLQCETELYILRSEQLLVRVFDALDLSNAPEISEGVDGAWVFLDRQVDKVEGLVTPTQTSTRALNVFTGRMRSRRLGLSYVIEISYRAYSAQQAARVVNSIASAYAAYRLRGVINRELRRGVYRQSRITNLERQLAAAETAMRSGTIPDDALADTDVRLLGPATLPLGSVFPKITPILVAMASFGAVTGLLFVLLRRDSDPQTSHRPVFVPHTYHTSGIA